MEDRTNISRCRTGLMEDRMNTGQETCKTLGDANLSIASNHSFLMLVVKWQEIFRMKNKCLTFSLLL